MAREEMISPEIQRQAIADYCARRGYILDDVIEDLDATGRNFTRKGVQQAIERVENAGVAVIVVWKFSRFGRSRKGWAVNLDRVESVGGRLESATEEVDATTSTGRFTRGLLGEVAAWESDRIGDSWKEAHDHRKRVGLPHSGGPRFGYIYHRATVTVRDGIKVCPQGCAAGECETAYIPDEQSAPLLAEAYTRFITGDGYRTVARWLNGLGSRTTLGNAWSLVTVRRVMDSGFAAGLIRVHDSVCRCKGPQNCVNVTFSPGAHDRVIEPKTWADYQRTRDARRQLPPRSREPAYPLSGLVRCGLCQAAMSPVGRNVRGTYRRGYTYYCTRYTHGGKSACRGVWVPRHEVEAYVLEWLKEFAAAEIDEDPASRVVRQAAKVVANVDRERLLREAQAIERALTKLTVDHARGIVVDAAYGPAAADLIDSQNTVNAQLDALEPAASEPEVPYVEVAKGLIAEWDTLAVSAKRAMLTKVIQVIHIAPPETSGDKPNSDVTPVWAAA